MRHQHACVFAALTALAGCAIPPHTVPIAAPPQMLSAAVQIAPGASLNLPLPPGYPQARSLHQVVRAQYGARRGAFEAVLSLAPERVDIVLIAPSGPRLASIAWDKLGITRTGTQAGLGAAPAENVLADIFLCLWPREAVAAALPAGLEVMDAADGARTITQASASIIEISIDPAQPNIMVLRNLAFDYQLRIETTP